MSRRFRVPLLRQHGPLLTGAVAHDSRSRSTGIRILSQLSLQAATPATRPIRVLLVCDSPEWPLVIRELAASHSEISVVRVGALKQARDPVTLGGVDAVVVWAPEYTPAHSELMALVEALRAQQLHGLLLQNEPLRNPNDGPVSLVSPDASADELWGRLAMIRSYRPLLQGLESQLSTMQRLGKRLNQQFVEVDQELRLASRLQRDFLPRSFPELGNVRFAALYRPATWVSGDVYDVRRLDEKLVNFYLADAVGHGVAAGLLTMFIRQAIVGKRVEQNAYQILACDEVLEILNTQLAEQELPNCQFVTACYGMVDCDSGLVSFARGGHPHPVHVRTDGTCEEVKTVGGLLGIMAGETFPSTQVHLEPGEKLIVYSDGLEDTIIARRDRTGGQGYFADVFVEAVTHSAQECLARLSSVLDHSEGSLQPLDDQSCLVIERLAEPA